MYFITKLSTAQHIVYKIYRGKAIGKVIGKAFDKVFDKVFAKYKTPEG